MAKKEKKAAPAAKETKKKAMTAEEKAAKKKARLEAMKNRPAEQRPNSKQIDVIDLGNGQVIKNFGYAIKNKEGHVGVVVTSVAMQGDTVTSTSVSFVPGSLTVKSKKNHGTICSPKSKKGAEEETDEDED